MIGGVGACSRPLQSLHEEHRDAARLSGADGDVPAFTLPPITVPARAAGIAAALLRILSFAISQGFE
jgi:hypothetical protein